MMKKPERIVLLVLVTAICALLLMMIFQDSPESDPVYSVSVVVRDPTDGFRKGVDQAALECNVDVHYVSGYAAGDTGQQMENLMREVSNGADAMVVRTESGYENDDEIVTYIAQIRARTPVVATGQELRRATCYVGADNYEIGWMLGELVVEKTGEQTCTVLCPDTRELAQVERLEGFRAYFDKYGSGAKVRYCRPDGSNISRVTAGIDTGAIAALNSTLTLEMARQARAGYRLFGVGFSGELRPFLEQRVLSGLVVYSEYDAGYLSLQATVSALRDELSNEESYLDLFKVTADNMYDDPYDKILFPID